MRRAAKSKGEDATLYRSSSLRKASPPADRLTRAESKCEQISQGPIGADRPFVNYNCRTAPKDDSDNCLAGDSCHQALDNCSEDKAADNTDGHDRCDSFGSESAVPGKPPKSYDSRDITEQVAKWREIFVDLGIIHSCRKRLVFGRAYCGKLSIIYAAAVKFK